MACGSGCVTPCSLFPGCVQVLAYGPTNPDAVIDVIVAEPLPPGAPLGFRFYPGNEGSGSLVASSSAFVLPANVSPGGFLRLALVPGGAELRYRPPRSAPSWTTIAVVSSPPVVYPGGACLVFTPTTGSGGLRALAFVTATALADGGTMPPNTTLDPKYVILPPATVAPGNFVVARTLAAVPGSWPAVWQLLKWGLPWSVVADAPGAYAAAVDPVESTAYIALTPGQLVPVAYKPYSADTAPGFGGSWALVATGCIPAGTVAYIASNAWDNAVDPTRAYVWQVPDEFDVPAGAIVNFTGLGTPYLRASYGTLTGASPPPGNQTGYILFSGGGGSGGPVRPITATLPDTYTGELPDGLEPGLDMLAQPWPSCPAILPVCNSLRPSPATPAAWLAERHRVNALCPERWVTQCLPAYSITDCCGAPCVGCLSNTPPPSTFPVTTPIMSGGPHCGCPVPYVGMVSVPTSSLRARGRR